MSNFVDVTIEHVAALPGKVPAIWWSTIAPCGGTQLHMCVTDMALVRYVMTHATVIRPAGVPIHRAARTGPPEQPQQGAA